MALLFRLLGVLMIAATASAVRAQDYPNRPIRLVIPFPAGGTTDIVGRLVAVELGKELGQTVLVENRVGSGGAIGTVEVARAAPDGYTLGLATVFTMAIHPACNPRLPYKSPDDFSMITNLAAVPNVIAVNPAKVNATSMEDFVAWLKLNAGKVSYATAGTCSIGHIMGESFKVATGTTMAHLPYRGAGPALNDVLAGRVGVLFDDLPSALPHIQQGRLKAIAIAAPGRLDLLPNVPTLGELNLAAVNDAFWYGLVAPAATPAPIVARLNAAVVNVLALPVVRDGLRLQGALPAGNTPAQFHAQVVYERDKMLTLVKRQRIRLDP